MRALWARRGVRELVLFALAAALSGFTLLREIGPHDEGLMLQAAQRIADGEWPYRDFWWNYGPGQPVVLAGLVKLFGPSLLWWRILRVALDALVAVLAYRIVRRARAPEWLSLLTWLAVAGAMAFPTGPGPNPAALALVGGALLLAPRSPVAAGALCGLAVAFRPEIGVAGAIATALTIRELRVLASAAVVAVAALLPFLVAAGGEMLDQAVGFLGVQHLQRLPFPLEYDGGADPNKVLEFYLPLLLLAGTAAWAVDAVWRRQRWALAAAPLLLVGVLYLAGRVDEFHLVPLSVVLSVALAISAAREPSRAARAVLLAVLVLIAVHGVERRIGQLRHPPALAAVPSPVADGARTTRDDAAALRDLLPALHALAPPGTPIFVAPPRLDQVRFGDPLLYVLAQRPNPTRFDIIQPGVVTTAEGQREIVADIERARPRAIVRWRDPRATTREPNGSARSSGVHLVDRWIAEHYREAGRFGPYVLLAPAGGTSGAASATARRRISPAASAGRPTSAPGPMSSGTSG